MVSYGVYLLHPLVLKGVAMAAGRTSAHPEALSTLQAWGMYAGCVVASVAVATLVFRTVEQPLLALKDVWAPYRKKWEAEG